MAKLFKRLSVAVDEQIIKILDQLAVAKNRTVSDVIREAILTYAEISEGEVEITEFKQYEEIFERRDNVIVDLEIWIALLDFVNAKGDEEFWKLIENIGYELGLEIKLRGLSLENLLEQMEMKNLLSFSKENEVYILTLVSRSATNMVTRLLRGALRAMEVDAEIIPGVRKMVIVDKKALKDKNLLKLMEESFGKTNWPVW